MCRGLRATVLPFECAAAGASGRPPLDGPRSGTDGGVDAAQRMLQPLRTREFRLGRPLCADLAGQDAADPRSAPGLDAGPCDTPLPVLRPTLTSPLH